MRRRILRTTKVLSIALAVLPACSKPTAQTNATAEPTSSAASQSAVAPSPPPPPPLASADPKLIDLSGELGTMTLAAAMSKEAHFRPLCDDKGYPLVGNLPPKLPLEGQATTSAFCAEVRKKKPS